KNKKGKIYECPIIYADGASVPRAIYTILPDDKGNFYLGSSHGLLYFNPKSKAFYQLDDTHPFYLKEFNRSSTLKTSNGKYYMGTVNGLYSFYPDELEFKSISNTASIPFLNKIGIKNKDETKNRYLYSDLNSKDLKLSLSPNDYNLSINFSSSNFDQQEVYYSYRIREFGETWNAPTTHPEIELFSIPPGKYTLDLQATLDPKFASDKFISIPISKSRVWYERWWVISLFTLSLMSGVALFIRNRYQQKLARQKELEKLRTKISSDLHDDVGSILSGLALQSEMMTYEADASQKESLNEMADMSRDALEKMRDTVWAIDSRKDKYIDLIHRMQAFADRNLGRKDIEYEFSILDIDKEAPINPERRQHLYLIFKEAITNVIRHSNADEVKITMSKLVNDLILSIYDNGSEPVAIQELENASGLGSSNMKMRARKLNGNAVFKYDKGFHVVVRIPYD
ncbi:MAG: histidine kinase, partial [Bacteroidota bacterium]